MALPAPSTAATALVTGASSGIGAEIALELARAGHHLTLAARRVERMEALAEEISTDLGGGAEVVGCDLADPDAREALEAAVAASGRTVEVLVNNAGFGHNGPFVAAEAARQVGMVRLNVEAVVDLCARFGPEMARRGRGAVINIASTAAFQPLPGSATYAAGKAFVLSFSEAVHAELAGSGVTVTAVCPGPVRTEFAERAGLGEAERSTPELIWTSAAEVARDAVRGAAAGKRVVVPGALNRAGAIAGQHTPRALALPLIRRFWPQA